MNSMTGYGRASKSFEDFDIDIELKSVNNKYLDINFNTPSYLNFLHEDIRKLVKTKLNRGRLDLYIRINQHTSKVDRVDLDIDLAEKIYDKLEFLKTKLSLKADIKVSDLISYPDILNFSYLEYNQDQLSKAVLEVLEEALESIALMREKEGYNLKCDLYNNLEKIKENMDNLEGYRKIYLESYRKKLEERVKDLLKDVNLDDERLYMELALLAEKSDINEEISRMYSHIEQFSLSIESSGPVGRRLDFIVQEMNREVNTISYKSSSKDITKSVIEMKAYIEKLREQIQNVE